MRDLEEAGKESGKLTESAQKVQKKQHEGKSTVTQKEGIESNKTPHKQFVYIGPSVPNGSLIRNSIFSGELEKIESHLSSVLAQFPKVKNLIVPISQLAAASIEIEQSGNALNRYYKELISEFGKGNMQ